MLVKESYLRKIIKESLLLEAIYKQKQLKELSPEVYSIIDKQFFSIDNTQGLDNEKSAGRFFIDVLYLCMQELLGEFDPATDLENTEFVEKVEDICSHLIYLFYQKEITSSTVQTGETFRDYIYAFMTSPKNFVIKNQEGHEVRDIISKIKTIFLNVTARSSMTGINRILQFKEQLKRKDTAYPFGNELVDGKYLVVQPLSMMSSIFWARTNYLAEDIVLPLEPHTKWCTSRYESNMFNTYFVAGGTNLFYFLPKDDIAGNKKSCVGLTKTLNESSEKEESVIGGHTTVNFENDAIIPDTQKVSPNVLNRVSRSLNISMETLNRLVEEMASKEAMDKYKYVSLIDLPQFKSVTNLNTLAPIDQKTKKRRPQDLKNIKDQIDHVINIYTDVKYSKRGYKPDKSITNYIIKMLQPWEKEGIKITLDSIKLAIFENPELKDSAEFLNKCIENMDSFNIMLFNTDLIFNRDCLMKLIDKNRFSVINNIDFTLFPQELKKDFDLCTEISKYIPETLKYFPEVLYNNKVQLKQLIKRDAIYSAGGDKFYKIKFDVDMFKKSKLYNDMSMIIFIAEILPSFFENHFPEFENDKRINFINNFPVYSSKDINRVKVKKYSATDFTKMKSIYSTGNETFKLDPSVIEHILMINPKANFTEINKLDTNQRVNIIANVLNNLNYIPNSFNEQEGISPQEKKYILDRLTPEEKNNKKICEYLLRNFFSSFEEKESLKNNLFLGFGDQVRKDKDFILRNRMFIDPFFYDEEILNDTDFLKKIITSESRSAEFEEKNLLSYLKKNNKIDENMVKLKSLIFWPIDIQNNEEICKFFIDVSAINLKYLKNEKVKNDSTFISQKLNAFIELREEDRYIGDKYFGGEEFYKSIGDTLKKNRKFILNFVKKIKIDLFKIDKTFNDDVEIANIVINNGGSKKYLSDRLKNNTSLLSPKQKNHKHYSNENRVREYDENVGAYYDEYLDLYFDSPVGGNRVDVEYEDEDEEEEEERYYYEDQEDEEDEGDEEEDDDFNESRNRSRKLIMTEATLKMLLRRYL